MDKKAARIRLKSLEDDWTALRLASFGILHQIEADAALLGNIAEAYTGERRIALRGLSEVVRKSAIEVKGAMDAEVHYIDAEGERLRQ